MNDDTGTTVTLQVTGNRIANPAVPALLRGGAVRGTPGIADPFLPDDYLRVVEAFDLGPAGRSASTAISDAEIAVQPGQILVLELPDGTTLVTSGERLREELERVAPEATRQAAVRLDDVQPRGAASRGLLDSLGRLVARVFVLDGGDLPDAIIDEALAEVRRQAGDALADRLRDGAHWGIDYVATRALMWAVERQLLRAPGLYRWVGAQKQPSDLFSIDDARLARAAQQGPLLVFIHGTASYTTGSFGDLRAAAREAQLDWDAVEARYGERIYGFEHRTFSESPIENALLLARTLPAGAQIDLVTHSRGGIVGDLLSLDCGDLVRTRRLIDGYRRFRTPDNRDAKDLDEADARDRRDLLALAAELTSKRFAIGRYVRVAAPVNGTLLAGANLDLFLSSLLTLFGVVTTLQASPFYLALKRIVIEIARNRADANRIPGLEAMLPGSAVSRLLRLASPQPGLRLGVIAGDIEGASRFKRLVEFLADWAIFARNDNDLVVDTASMDTGLARPDNARRLFVQGPGVSHFSYFANADSRAALAGWLTAADPAHVPGFDPLGRALDEPGGVEAPAAALRGAEANLPVVIVLPGIMGSHLQVDGKRVWFDPLGIALGRLDRLAYDRQNPASVSAEKLFDMFYGDLCRHLAATHAVVRFPYDWRRPVEHAAQKLAEVLRAALARTEETRLPVRIVAHSMGGLVTRAMAALDPALWDAFLARDGARFVMLGTPNQGSHLMVEMLIGKGDTVRQLATLEGCDLQKTLDLVAGFPGALQLLPRPGFSDGGTPIGDYYQTQVWQQFKSQVVDFWFGSGKVAVPTEQALSDARTLWQLPDFSRPQVPGGRPDKVIYVCGKADNTPCGITLAGNRLKMVGTPEGDGSVSWSSGRIDGIDSAYLMDAAHGNLADTEAHFESLVQLLADGSTPGLPQAPWSPAALRGGAAPIAAPAPTIVYDAPPATVPTDEQLARTAMGAGTRRRPARRRAGPAVLQVACAAMDLRFARDPILVGHYERDPLAGAEALIDRDVVCNELTMRKHLGLYAGPIGTATVVLVEPNAEEQLRGVQHGAVVAGLGEWGELTAASLTEAVRAAALRYLLTMVERRGAVCAELRPDEPPIDVGLASLLLGHNSTANISISDSVNALVRGVLEANRQFAQMQRRGPIARIVRLEIVECYLDIAASAAMALRGVAASLASDSTALGMRVEARDILEQRQGARPRLEALTGMGYWPRLIVTGVDDDRRALGEAAHEIKAPATRRARVAEKLKYVYLAQRARAETELLQRQPGLIEKLVSLSVDGYQRDLSRTLFHLMVPLDFKEAARQTDKLALLVDDYTANFPWELMCADDAPLVTRTAVVRQFVSTDWRRRVRSTVDRTAYVVGNPSTSGFAQAFPGKANKGNVDPRPLPGAEAEAYAVARVLRANGYEPTESIGNDQRAVDVINRLFQRPYRIVHVAAHGEFDIGAADGTRRSGVLLSDGLMLTAAEINQMEIVPDLVFMNCCHLGQIDDRPVGRDVEFNRLAASLARQLIDMGVRAVVVAGWAVDDRAGQSFAEAFYRYLVGEGRAFGMAVHQARLDTYRDHPASNTWGAFQAYGDPGFLIDPARGGDGSVGKAEKFAAVGQLVDALERMREGFRDRERSGAAPSLAAMKRSIDALLARCPADADWLRRGDVLYQVGMVFAQMGDDGFDRARDNLLRAIEVEEKAERVPIKAIEELGNMEVHRGASIGDLELIDQGVQRLQQVIRAVAADPRSESPAPTAERCGLLGSAFKRKAQALAEAGKAFVDDLEAARRWYALGENRQEAPAYSAYCALNRLMLDALLGRKEAVDPARLRSLANEARQRYAATRDYWDALHPADARLTEALAFGRLEAPQSIEAEAVAVTDAYGQVRRSLPESAKSLASVVKQIGLLALFAGGLGRTTLAESLRMIAGRLRGADDGRAGGDVPAGRKPSSGPAAAAAAKAGQRDRGKSSPRPRAADSAAPSRSTGTTAQFSRFFTLGELTRSDTAEREGIPNQPTAAEIECLRTLCVAILDPLREAIARPIKVNSGYRGPALNRRIGGAANSQHAQGKAADIQAPGMAVLALFQTVIRLGLPFDQLIYEAKNATAKWVHVSHNAGANRGEEIRVAEFDAGGRPLRYPQISRQQALALSEPVSRAGGEAIEPDYVEMGDEPRIRQRSRAPAAAGPTSTKESTARKATRPRGRKTVTRGRSRAGK